MKNSFCDICGTDCTHAEFQIRIRDYCYSFGDPVISDLDLCQGCKPGFTEEFIKFLKSVRINKRENENGKL